MGSIANNIQAFVRTLKEMLDEKKYQVDYFQREYKWERKHIEQLLIDLEASFMSNYEVGHFSENVANYNCYYLGPVVLSQKETIKSIVDGQQRLTSMTLLLIYLNNLQKNIIGVDIESIESLIYSKKYGRKSYNIEVPDRTKILDILFNEQITELSEDELDESVKNMFDRYEDIRVMFSDDLKGDKLPLFIEWLKEKVVFVEIIAFTDENAYTIFETMNDRGLNLTPTEMLKGYLLTNVKDNERIHELNILWKNQIASLHSYSSQEDIEFIKAWLRSAYAESIRPSTKGAENEDFEKIGTRFHTWIRDNSKRIGLKNVDSFYYFIKSDFLYYSDVYKKIVYYMHSYDKDYETLFLFSHWGIASSLSIPLLLAPINKLDDDDVILKKINIVSKFLDYYTIVRVLNNKTITQTSIRYFVYSLVKEVRRRDIEELRKILKDKLLNLNETIPEEISLDNFERKFTHYLLARIVYFVEQSSNTNISFDDLMVTRKRSRFVVAPILRYTPHSSSETLTEDEYASLVYSIGNHVMIPNTIAIEFNETDTIEKLELLRFENIFSSSCYQDVTKSSGNVKVVLPPIAEFNAANIRGRASAIKEVINKIWAIDNL